MPGLTVGQLLLNIAVNSQQGQQGLSQFQASLKNLGLTTQQINGIMQQFGGKGQQLVASMQQLSTSTTQTQASLKQMGLTTQQANVVMQQWGSTSQQTNAIMQQLGITTPQLTKSLKEMGLTSQQADGVMRELGVTANKTGEEYNQLTNYVKRAAIAFAAFKALDIMRDFVTGTVEAAKNAENFGNALRAALPEGVSFSQTMKDMGETTRGLIPEWEQMRMATQLYASGLANTSEEAAKLANAGVILTTVFRGQNATWDKYFRLLQGGTKQLYDNFNLSKLQIDALTDQIQATTGLSTEEAKLQAIRKVVIEQGEKFKDSLGDLTSATMTAQAAWQDYMALVGTGAKDAIIGANSVITKLIIRLIGQKKASDEAAIGAYKMGMSYKDWTEAAHAAGVDIRGLTEDLYAQAQASKAGQEPLDLWMRLMAAQAEVTQGAAEANRVWVASHGNMLGNLDLGIQLLPSYIEEWDKLYGNKNADKWAEQQQEAAIKAREAMYEYKVSIGEYFSDLGDMQLDYNRFVSDHNADAADAVNEFNDKKIDYTISFNDKIEDLEVDRAEKLKWVRDGAWKRTKEEEAAAEKYWNDQYDKKEMKEKRAYDRQIKNAADAEAKKQAEIAKQLQREREEYEKNLEHLKLVAALTAIEASGQLQTLMGPAVSSADQAATLLEEHLIRPSDALLAAIAGASQGLTQLGTDIEKSGTEDAPKLANALAGKVGGAVTILNNAIGNIPIQYQSMADFVANSAVMVGSAVVGLTGRTTEANTGVDSIATSWSDLLRKTIIVTPIIKTQIQKNVEDPLTATTMAAGLTKSGISDIETETKKNLEDLTRRIGVDLVKALNDAKGAAEGTADAIDQVGTAGGGATGGPTVVTPTVVPTRGMHTYYTGQGRAKGGAFIVPPGYERDNYPVFVSSGEAVTVVPKDRVARFAKGTVHEAMGLPGIPHKLIHPEVWVPEVQERANEQIRKWAKEYIQTFADVALEIADIQDEMKTKLKEYNDEVAEIQANALKDQTDERKSYTDDLAKLNDKIVDIETDRKNDIVGLNQDAAMLTKEEYAYELAKLNAYYDEKVKVQEDANAVEAAKLKVAYKEQLAIIVTEEVKKIAVEQQAYAAEMEQYDTQVKSLKLKAALTVIEMTGRLEELTGGFAKTAEEATKLIEAGLIPITGKLKNALSAAVGGMSVTSAAAEKTVTANKKILDQLLGTTYTPTPEASALTQLISTFTMGGTTGGALNQLATSAANVMVESTGSFRAFMQAFGVAPELIDQMLGTVHKGKKDTLIPVVDVADVMGNAISAIQAIASAAWSTGQFPRPVPGPAAQHGLDMIVPPGYARDSFPVYVRSGERVTVTPPGVSRTNQINITGNWNPQTEGDLMRYVKIASLMRQ